MDKPDLVTIIVVVGVVSILAYLHPAPKPRQERPTEATVNHAPLDEALDEIELEARVRAHECFHCWHDFNRISISTYPHKVPGVCCHCGMEVTDIPGPTDTKVHGEHVPDFGDGGPWFPPHPTLNFGGPDD